MAKGGSAWSKRNAAAKAKGYRNYYDYRVHDYGKRPAAEPVQTGTRIKKGGQHTKAGFRRLLRKPDRLSLIVEAPTRRGADGEWKNITYIVITNTGDMPAFYITLTDEQDLDYWRGLIDDAEVEFLEYSSADVAAAQKKAKPGKRAGKRFRKRAA